MKKFVLVLFTLLSGLFTPAKADLPGDKLPVPPVIQPIVGQEGKWLSVILPTFTGGGSVYLDYTLRRFSGSPHNDPGVSMPEGVRFNTSLRNLYGWPTKAGTYTFMYAAKASNGNVGLVPFTLIIKPNLVPVAPTVSHREVKAGEAFSIQLPEFTDPEKAPLTYAVGKFFSSEPLPSWITFDASTRKLTGTPPATAGKAESVMLQYGATDEGGRYNAVGILLAVKPKTGSFQINYPAVAPKIPAQHAEKGKPVLIQLPAFTDKENNLLTYTLYKEGSSSTLLPNGLSFDPNTRTIIGIPTQGGHYQILYVATHPEGGLNLTMFSLMIDENVMPVPPPIPSQVLEPGEPFSFQFPKFTDPENDPLTYFLDLGVGVSSTINFFPSWMRFDAATRTVSGTAPQYEESFLLSYRAKDPYNTSVAQFKVTVRKNRAPVAPTVKNMAYPVNKPLSVRLPVFVDPDHDPVTLTLVGSNYQLPEGITFKPGDREISGTPRKTGVYTLHYIAKDSKGLISSVSFQFTVTGPGTVGARIATESAETPRPWTATVLGNPVVGDEVEVEVNDAQGESLKFELLDLAGRSISEQSKEINQNANRIRLTFRNQLPGLYLLKITSRSQTRTLKVVKEQ